MYFSTVAFPFPIVLEATKTFSFILTLEILTFLEIMHNFVGVPNDLVPLSHLTLIVVHTETPTILYLYLRFSSPCTDSWVSFHSSVSAPLNKHSLYYLIFPTRGAMIYSVSSPLLWIQKEFLIFKSGQDLQVRVKWWLSSSLHEIWKPKSFPFLLFNDYFMDSQWICDGSHL